MNRHAIGVSLILALALFLAPAQAQLQDVKETPGIKIGEKAPNFKLKDQEGKEHTLDSLLGKSHVALVFHRSADW